MRWMLVVLATMVSAGCNTRTNAARMAELEVPEPAMPHTAFDDARVLVRRFSDARPREASRTLGGAGFIVPSGYRSEYTTQYFDKGKRGTATVYLGSLPNDLPYLLARSLPGDKVTVADDLHDAGAGTRWDYVVEGRVLQSRGTSWYSVGLAFLSPFGAPGRFDRYELGYELSLFAADEPDHPLLTRAYRFDDRVTVGLYYGRKRSERLTRDALENVLAQSSRDLVREVEQHRSRARAAPADLNARPAESRDSGA